MYLCDYAEGKSRVYNQLLKYIKGQGTRNGSICNRESSQRVTDFLMFSIVSFSSPYFKKNLLKNF